MGEDCLRRGCPCLSSLWDYVFKKKPPSVGGSRPGTPVPDPGNEPPANGTSYTAMWPFEAGHPDELSFREGDLFTVVDRSGAWWTAHKMDRSGRVQATGIVPSNYLSRADSLNLQPWYFGTMSRLEAQSHLMAPDNQDGAFMVRHSQKGGVGHVLSVKFMNLVKHYKIHQSDEGASSSSCSSSSSSSSSSFFIEPSLTFDSLVRLVEHYSTHSLGTAGTGGTAGTAGTGVTGGTGGTGVRISVPCKRREPSRPDLTHVTVDDWNLPKEQFTVLERLGSGCFSDVYRGRWKNMINVAIKILKSDSEVDEREFHREVEILRTLRHRYLISLFAVCTNTQPYYIITEFMEKGNLQSFLRGPEGPLQAVSSLVDMSVQVVEAMVYLEEHHSIHRDLAARNVLVGGDYICRVADFGLARVIKEPFYMIQDKKIPYKWSAPEAISHGMFSSKSDVWSFGVLLYEIFTYGGNPYPTMTHQEVYDQVVGGYRMPQPPRCTDLHYAIMLQCWQAEPEDRPSFLKLERQLLSDHYVM